MEIINVGLYGGKGIFGGRETPLEVSIIRCDKFEKCSYYKNKQCLNVRAAFSGKCKHGSVNTIRGYTSRARKYYKFKDEWESHEKYGLLKYPPEKLGLIDGKVVFAYRFIQIEEENGNFKLSVPYFSNRVSFIEYEKFDVELINKICKFRPQAMMGGTISSYQKEVIPLFLAHLKEVLPERFEELKGRYPELIKEVNYVGRKALLRTVKPSLVEDINTRYPQFDSKWYWNGEFLIYKGGYVHNFDIVNDYEIEEIKIKPSDKATIKITDNEQVTEKTVFVD